MEIIRYRHNKIHRTWLVLRFIRRVHLPMQSLRMKITWQWRAELEVCDMYMAHSIQVIVDLKHKLNRNIILDHSKYISNVSNKTGTIKSGILYLSCMLVQKRQNGNCLAVQDIHKNRRRKHRSHQKVKKIWNVWFIRLEYSIKNSAALKPNSSRSVPARIA